MGEEEQGVVTASFLAIAGFKEGYYTLSFSAHESIVFRYEILLSRVLIKKRRTMSQPWFFGWACKEGFDPFNLILI